MPLGKNLKWYVGSTAIARVYRGAGLLFEVGGGTSTYTPGLAGAKAITTGSHWPISKVAQVRTSGGVQPTNGQRIVTVFDNWGTTDLGVKSGDVGPTFYDFEQEGYVTYASGAINESLENLVTGEFSGTRLFADATDAFSVTVLFNNDVASNGAIFAKAGGTAANRQLMVSTTNTGSISVSVRGVSTELFVGTDYRDGLWHVLNFVWDGTNAYVEVDNGGLNPVAVGTAAEETDQRFCIGARTNGGGFYFKGDFSDVVVAADALSHQMRQEIAQEIGATQGLTLQVTATDGGSVPVEPVTGSFTVSGGESQITITDSPTIVAPTATGGENTVTVSE